MSTPLKALIQERLRAKMVCRGAEYDLDDFYECNSASVDVPTRHLQPLTAPAKVTTTGIAILATIASSIVMRVFMTIINSTTKETNANDRIITIVSVSCHRAMNTHLDALVDSNVRIVLLFRPGIAPSMGHRGANLVQ
ncbi:uncharacterized protein PITG_08716 [Phytophthora infestans T30-4]|uniref:Uncharacterized protein n=1 Tax=Phytophthora infestans (strain T30-4) TaxID=403677 RepID=D0ND12_PHYIT|nr:uncharacterized protein PITG_08716 [Phytophthora infestans T30-4]EEY55969.1 hypothetical protein PITG_08716 [Phytophthora infestans T30-4]|eukprot:XP_002902799.1 hypothetical protein PITG_08716 [Phytophthora infestans T30-4]